MKADAKNVRMSWSEDLRDKRVWIADNVRELVDKAESLDIDNLCFVEPYSDELGYAFKVKYTNITCALVYYDPYIELKLAVSKGKQIETRCKGSQDPWIALADPCFDTDTLEYRIKPEKQCTYKDLLLWLKQNNGFVRKGSYVRANYEVEFEQLDSQVPKETFSVSVDLEEWRWIEDVVAD